MYPSKSDFFYGTTTWNRHLKEALLHVGDSGLVVHIAHSQYAILTYLVSKRLSADELKRTEDGVALQLDSKPFWLLVYYYALNDALLFLLPVAVKGLRFGSLQATEKEEFVFLSPRVGV